MKMEGNSLFVGQQISRFSENSLPLAASAAPTAGTLA